ncbi:hypothetical protein Hanom_Chr00s000723g01655941 [Helianthus anomalus]
MSNTSSTGVDKSSFNLAVTLTFSSVKYGVMGHKSLFFDSISVERLSDFLTDSVDVFSIFSITPIRSKLIFFLLKRLRN